MGDAYTDGPQEPRPNHFASANKYESNDPLKSFDNASEVEQESNTNSEMMSST